MKTHLILLRGINVSGHNLIKMDALTKMLLSMGFEKVQTYIQSGNVILNSDETPSKIAFTIKQEIFKEFGHDVPVLVINQQDLEDCLSNNLFLKEKEVDLKKLYVAFVSMELNENSIHDLKISNIKPDEVQIDRNKIFIKYAVSPAKTRLDQKYIEKKLNVKATIRNWNTINNLLEICINQPLK
jgi:uncharacterized protein (DUF1697 family)